MISLAVFALGALICLESFILNTRYMKIARDTISALLVSESQIEKILLSPGERPEEGTYSVGQQTFDWNLEFKDLPVSETEIFQVQVGQLTVRWPEGKVSLTVPILKKEENGKR
ncbi:MAG: hypothetical protein NC823_02930 [Candidatus Omnitrophica bacterium]|nr:hypothetical protein [Candidatus Omnitrophota bacterium]